MHKFILSIIVAFSPLFFSAGKAPVTGEKMVWMTLKEAQEAMLKEKRPILIDLYTDWCGWCKVMDKKTYTNPKVIAYLQANFYAVKLNAETREAVNWNEKTYNYNAANRTNDRRSPNINVPSINREGYKWRDNLRNDTVDDDL